MSVVKNAGRRGNMIEILSEVIEILFEEYENYEISYR